jgi:dihydroxy-acid dehydratase
MRQFALESGRRIVAMVNEELCPKQIMTPKAFENAVAVGLAVSGSINLLRHLQGVAAEGEVDVDIYRLVDELGKKVPLLCAIKPNGPGRIEDMERAGGAAAVMKQLESVLNREVITVTGQTLERNLESVRVLDASVIGSLQKPLHEGPSIVILKGSLAPEGAIMKLGLGDKPSSFRGTCRVFETQEAALAALFKREIKGGEVVVLRGLGARGGPGVASASWFVAAVNGGHLGKDIAVITDGQLSGLNRGYTIGQVMPEAADGGPIALTRDGDSILIDVANRKIELEISPAEMASRRAALPAFVPGEKRGWLQLYQNLVQPLQKGGTLKPTR